MSEFKNALQKLFAQAEYAISPEQMDQMDIYYNCMVRENKKYNLTGIVEPHDAALKHFLDSVTPVGELPHGAVVMDVGSGAGFPAVPLKILSPDITMHALDATQKKCNFIEMAASEAGIAVEVLNGRAEEQTALREKFDCCVSRAVADLPVLLELCAHFVRVGGLVLAYKANVEQERERGATAARVLGLSCQKTLDFPIKTLHHGVLIYQKTEQTPQKYPRKFAQIVKRPL